MVGFEAGQPTRHRLRFGRPGRDLVDREVADRSQQIVQLVGRSDLPLVGQALQLQLEVGQ